GSYKTAGGLHGVGASVVNALSKELVAHVRRDGAEWEQRFKQGQPLGPPRKIGPARGSGSKIFFRPDPAIFPKVELDAAVIRERLHVASYLHKGLQITFEEEAERTKVTFEHSEGLLAYLKKIVTERGSKPIHDTVFTLEKQNGLRLDLVLQWTEATDEHIRSYVNGLT